MRHQIVPKLLVAHRALRGLRARARLLVIITAIISCTHLRTFDAMADSQQGLIATSAQHTCALTKATDGGVRCWGSNMQGQLGDNTTFQRTSPVDVVGLSSGVVSVGTGTLFSCALLAIGEVRCWGSNTLGQLGNNNYGGSQVPVPVVHPISGNPLTGVTSLSVGASHACVVLSSGAAKCWGNNIVGQLGDGTSTNSLGPVDVVGFGSNVKTIAAGSLHSCLVSISPNRIYCFGSNADFQLGDGSGVDSSVPVVVPAYSNVVEVTAGAAHSCARRTGGDVICWGNNLQGTLGNGTGNASTLPVAVSGIGTDGARVSAGTSFTCATRASDGEVLCWGRGAEGQLGDGSLLQRNGPVSTNPSVKGAVDIAAGGSHACVWMGTCSAKCWGTNGNGQLGNGTTTNASNPVSITVCNTSDPTPTPTPTPTSPPPDLPTNTPTPQPDACGSESNCIPDSSLTNPLDPKPPTITVNATTSKKAITLVLAPVRLGVPTNADKREFLRKKLATFFKRSFKNLSDPLKLLDIYFAVSIVKAPALTSNSFEAQAAMPNKYKVETRKRRVTTRLAPGTYVAKVTVRLKDKKGRTFTTGTTAGQARFAVR